MSRLQQLLVLGVVPVLQLALTHLQCYLFRLKFLILHYYHKEHLNAENVL